LGQISDALALPSRFRSRRSFNVAIYDVEQNQLVDYLPASAAKRLQGIGVEADWSPDATTVAFLNADGNNLLTIWDIPPCKSLTWFAAGAAILALPIALVAWRRTRKLRAA
jgi:hypothetical protein